MQNVSRAILLLVTSIISLIAFSGFADDPQMELRQKLQAIQSFEGNFKQDTYNSRKNLLKEYQGHFYLVKPNQFRWDIEMPVKKIIISNGKQLWVYNPALQQVFIQSLQQKKIITPAALLSASASGVLNDFYIKKISNWFVLTPKISTFVKRVSLKFQGPNLMEMQILDTLDQTSVILINQSKMNQRIQADLFSFKPKTNVDVINLKGKAQLF